MELQLLKYQFIEEIMQVNSEALLVKLAEHLRYEKKDASEKVSWTKFIGIWTDNEANKFQSTLKE